MYEAAVREGRRIFRMQFATYAMGNNAYCRFYQAVPLLTLEAEIAERRTALKGALNAQNWAPDVMDAVVRTCRAL
jgi:hypothetical protein